MYASPMCRWGLAVRCHGINKPAELPHSLPYLERSAVFLLAALLRQHKFAAAPLWRFIVDHHA